MRIILINIPGTINILDKSDMKVVNSPKSLLIILAITITYGCSNEPASTKNARSLTEQQILGKQLFFEARFSEPTGQACASCHNPDAGFARAQEIPATPPVSPGAVVQRFGNRNTPTISYAAYIPELHFDSKEKHYVGGLFLDGRENSLESQAKGPLFNPVEMAVPDKTVLFQRLKSLGYEAAFKKVYGEKVFSDADTALEKFVLSIAAYERSFEFSPFNSKYDAYLNGKAKLTKQEQRGLKVFEAEDKGNCAACHPSQPDAENKRPLFTDYTYDNLGVPAHPKNPFYKQPTQFNPDGNRYIDTGLGTIVKDTSHNGKFRVPSLRNIALTAPYMHNGVFETLKEVVDFYNTRDIKKWPKPEVAENVNKDELGDLKLTENEVDDLVAFMETLTDGYVIK